MSNLSNKNCILVTGGSGFVGSHLIDKLIKAGYFIINIDKYDYNSYDNTKNINNAYKFVQCNVLNREMLLHLFNEWSFQIIYHLAAQSHVDNTYYNSIQFTYDNILASHNLLETIKEYNDLSENKIKKIIYLTTDEVNDKDDNNIIVKPDNPYSVTKVAAEMLFNSYYKSYNLPIIIARSCNIFGSRQYPEQVIASFIYNLLNNNKCYIHNKEDSRYFIYIDNVIDALLLLNSNGEIGKIYNITSNDKFTIYNIAKLLIEKIHNDKNYDNYIEYIDKRNFKDYRNKMNDISLKNLGWEIKVDFNEGLQRTIQSFKKNNTKK